MRRMAFSFLTLLRLFRPSSCAALDLASPTVTVTGSNDGRPSPTPTSPALGNLEARERADSLCGYYEGDAARPFLCNPGYDCLHNTEYNAVGCVSVGAGESTFGAVFTACLNYVDYMSGFCSTAGSRTGCCQNSEYPACIRNTYTGSAYEGYTMVWCAAYDDHGALLAWDYSTSGLSATTTMFISLPINTNTHTETPVPAQTQAPTSTPSPAPTAQPQGLSTSDKITLGTALGIGLPAMVAGIIAAWYTYKAWEKRKKGTLLKDDDQDTLLMDNSESNRSSKVSNPGHITMTLL
ncbi:hypothetical protein F4818DRAFT_424642 [Hypoxylon cercidicola]|nr:hypothetical protein F4818DRAFT_424642 [Hypoxylon cercidicola]